MRHLLRLGLLSLALLPLGSWAVIETYEFSSPALEQRYQLLSAGLEDWDNDTQPGKEADFRFLVSAGPFEIVLGSDGTFMPSRSAGRSLQEEYLVFDESIASRADSEPYSGLFDLDGDGLTNAEEYEMVVVVGGGRILIVHIHT